MVLVVADSEECPATPCVFGVHFYQQSSEMLNHFSLSGVVRISLASDYNRLEETVYPTARYLFDPIMAPNPQLQEHHHSPMAAAAEAALQDLMKISSICSGDDRILTFGDPPLDHIEDDDSYEMIVASRSPSSPPHSVGRVLYHPHQHSQTLSQGSKATTTRSENKGRAPPSPSRRGNGPVDVDALDEMSVSLDSRQGLKCFDSMASFQETYNFRRSSAPVDLDETVVDDEESTVLENCLPRPVDMDSVQEREEDFSMIWKEHEDEFLVWRGNEQLQMLALKNARARQKPSYGQSRRGDGKNISRAFKNDKYLTEDEQNSAISPQIVIDYDDKEECNHHDSASVSSRSLDTFGFSLMEASVDSYGFSRKGSNSKTNRGIPPATSPNTEDTSTVSSVPRTVASSEESRARTIQRIREVLNKDPNTEDTSTVEGLCAKARGLRASRLRSTNYMRTQRIEPTFSTVHEHEALPAPVLTRATQIREESINEEHHESFALVEYPGNYGLMVQVKNDRTDATQSVVSDISNLSDKLFLRVKSEPESKWDEFSSVGMIGVEGKPGKIVPPAEDDNVLNSREVAPDQEDVEEPPVYYDASVKTPPILYNREMFDEIKANDDEDPKSNWDDVSSIGLLGVEGLRRGEKIVPTPEVHIPIVITSGEIHHGKTIQSDRASKIHSNTKKPPQDASQDIFRPRKQTKASSKTQDVSLNPTFSTVRTGDSDESSAFGDFNDPEEQKEVSITSESLAEYSKQSEVTRRYELTPRDWLIIAAIFLVTVTAISIIVFYVYANL